MGTTNVRWWSSGDVVRRRISVTVLIHVVQMFIYRPNATAEWEIAERGLAGDLFWWRPSRINFDPMRCEFRVRAANSEGFGQYAYSKEERGEHAYYVRRTF